MRFLSEHLLSLPCGAYLVGCWTGRWLGWSVLYSLTTFANTDLNLVSEADCQETCGWYEGSVFTVSVDQVTATALVT